MMQSLKARFILATLLILLVFASVTSFFLDRQFRRKVLEIEGNRAQTHIYALLASTEVNLNGAVEVEVDRLPTPFMANAQPFVISPQRQLMWSLGPLTIDVLAAKLPGFDKGELTFEMLDQDTFWAVFPVEWRVDDVEGQAQYHHYYFGLVSPTKDYQRQVADNRNTLMLWISLGSGLLLLLQLLILQWGLYPVRRVQQQVLDIQSHTRTMLSQDVPRELQPLVVSLNHLLQHLEHQTISFKDALSNLAHQLKTPLAAQKALLQSGKSLDTLSQDLADQVTTMQSVIDYHLQKSRLLQLSPFSTSVAIRPIIERTVAALRKAHGDKLVNVHIDVPDNQTLPVQDGVLLELFATVIDNSFKWCRHTIHISSQSPTAVDIVDDGPGFPMDKIQDLKQRGARADENVPGFGQGLAIVDELMRELGGNLVLERSSTGGACVRLIFS